MSQVNRTARFTPFFLSSFITSLLLSSTLASAAEELVLEEVLVTAQKQEQTVQDTPVALNAISAQTYNDMASFDLSEVDRLTAGVDISGDSFNIDFKVRGVGTNLDAGTPSRVNLFKDGAFINQQRAIFLSQFDLERFELLRGPQGTLYGKSSPAGQLIIHTKDPSLTHNDGYVQISAFSRDGSNTQFGVSQPLIEDKLGLRIAGVFDKNSNSDIHNETRNEDQINRTSAGRVTLKWLANDKLDVRLSYNYTENSGDYFTVTDQQVGTYDDAEDRKAYGNEKGYVSIRDKHAIGQVNYALNDDITITGVTMYQELYTERFFDADRGASGAAAGGGSGNRQTQFVRSNIGKVLNSELRIHNTTNENWKWITGVYYQHSRASTPVTAYTDLDFGVGFGLNTNTFDIVAANKTEEFGIFHHSGIQINDRDRLTLGIRYNDSRLNALSPFSFTSSGAFTPPAGGSGQGIPLANEKRQYQEFTGTIKFQRDFNDDTTAYFSFDRGWRPGSSTVDAGGNIPGSLVLHDDEPSTNFELGLKGRYWNDRADYQLALYRQMYQDFQFQADGIIVDASPNPATTDDGILTNDALFNQPSRFNAVVNADKVMVDGVEFESNVLLSENWVGFYSLSYVDVAFEKFDDAPCNVNAATVLSTAGDGITYATCDFSGQRATEAPNFSSVVSTEYSQPITDHGIDWYVRMLAKHESARYFSSIDESFGDSTIVDVFAGVRSHAGDWDLMVWAKNATDETVIESIDFSPTGTSGIVVNNPFTAGITATWRFGLED